MVRNLFPTTKQIFYVIFFRHDQGVPVEGTEAELRSDILNASHRSRHVLLIQQAEGRQDVQDQPLPGSDDDND